MSVSAPPPPPARRGADETALRVILAYKLIKGLLLVVAGVVLTGAILFGLGVHLQEFAVRAYEHATGAWALHASRLLARITSPKWLRWSAVALELDGTMNLIEAWALRKGHAWGPWLVVVITALFLPVEAWELSRHPRPGRLVLLLANLAILVFLVWYARRHAATLGRRAPTSPLP